RFRRLHLDGQSSLVPGTFDLDQQFIAPGYQQPPVDRRVSDEPPASLVNQLPIQKNFYVGDIADLELRFLRLRRVDFCPEIKNRLRGLMRRQVLNVQSVSTLGDVRSDRSPCHGTFPVE